MVEQLIWFSLAVLPLVVIPGPDMLLCIAQGLTRGYAGLWCAVHGITLGYLAHAVLAAIGVAAIVVASPIIFETVRWMGIAYLTWIACSMLRRAFFESNAVLSVPMVSSFSLWSGFLTSFLNPKGLFVYLLIVPQFIDPARNVNIQAFVLSIANAVLCYVVYATIGLIAVRLSVRSFVSIIRIRILEGIAGALLSGIAIRLIFAGHTH